MIRWMTFQSNLRSFILAIHISVTITHTDTQTHAFWHSINVKNDKIISPLRAKDEQTKEIIEMTTLYIVQRKLFCLRRYVWQWLKLKMKFDIHTHTHTAKERQKGKNDYVIGALANIHCSLKLIQMKFKRLNDCSNKFKIRSWIIPSFTKPFNF